MTVSHIANSKIYPGDGSGPPQILAVPFQFFDSDELDVVETIDATQVQSVMVIGDDYLVTGGGGSTGTVESVAVIAVGVSWTVTRNTALTQDTDYSAQDTFPEQSHEDALDKQMLVAQDVDAKTERAVRISASDDQTIDMTLPLKVDRASKTLLFDANGAPAAGDPIDPGTVFFSLDGTALVGKTDALMRTQLRIIPQLDSNPTNRPIIGIYSGNNGGRPNAVTAGDGAIFISTDHLRILASDGANWQDLIQEFSSRANLPAVSAVGGRLFATNDSGELFIDDDSTGPVPINVASRGMMQGFKASWSSVTLAGCGEGQCSSELDIAGVYRNFLSHATGMEKSVDNTWEAGDGNGGWPDNTVTLPFGGWIHFFALGHEDGVQTDFGWDTDVLATNLRADAAVITADFHHSFRRIYSIKTLDDGGGPSTSQDIMRIRQQGDWFYYDDPTALINDDLVVDTPSALHPLLNAPLGIESQILLNINMDLGTDRGYGITSGIATDVDGDLTAPVDGEVPAFGADSTDANATQVLVHTDALQRVRLAVVPGPDTINTMVIGWMDDRGRYA